MEVHGPENIEAEFDRMLREHLTSMYRDELGHPDYEWRISRRKHEVEREKLLLKCQEGHSGPVSNLRVLNVGSGWGGYIQAALEAKAETYGIDVDSEVVKIANLRLGAFGLKARCVVGIAESMPFQNSSFDRINCFSVLEHVHNVKDTVSEIARVLRKGGIAYLHFPNHWYPYEGHYKMTWFPFMPKRLARFYLRVLGRPSRFINHINYLSPGIFEEICRVLPVSVERLSNDFYSVNRLKSIQDRTDRSENPDPGSNTAPIEMPLLHRLCRSLDARMHKHVIAPLYRPFNIAPICNFALHKKA